MLNVDEALEVIRSTFPGIDVLEYKDVPSTDTAPARCEFVLEYAGSRLNCGFDIRRLRKIDEDVLKEIRNWVQRIESS